MSLAHTPTQTVPLLDLTTQYAKIREQVLEAVTRVCDSQRFILGPEVESLESELADLLGVEHTLGMSSGTDALLAAFMAIGLRPGDEVVTTTYSFFATAGCVSRLGARPVLVDIDPVTYNLDPEAVAAAVTPRTRAIVPVHLFGLCADLDPILAMASKAGIPVIGDACQAIGATYKGRPVAGLGTAACFSFFPSKNLGGSGDGGLLTCRDAAFARVARTIRHHGQTSPYVHGTVGGNFRLDAIQAAILRVKAPHLPEWNAARRENAARYGRLFSEMGLVPRVTPPAEPDGHVHVYHQYVIRTPRRDKLREHLLARGITTAVYYPVPFHLQPCFADLGYTAGAFPHAERAARETLALPIFPELTADQQTYVVETIAGFLNQ
jgi:dTDP-4-amino-4,6-dideoxygalactose transaminase